MVSINTNKGSMQGQQTLAEINARLSDTQNRINTGKRVAGPKLDGATFGVSTMMASEASSWRVVEDSLARGQSVTDVAASAAEAVSDLVTRMKEQALAFTGADKASKATIRQEIEDLARRIYKTVTAATFDGINMLDMPNETIPISTSAAFGPTASFSFSDPAMGGYWFDYTLEAQGVASVSAQAVNSWPSGAPDVEDFTPIVGTTTGYPGSGLSTSATFTAQPDTTPPAVDWGIRLANVRVHHTRTSDTFLAAPDGTGITVFRRALDNFSLGLEPLEFDDPEALIAQVGGAQAKAIEAAAHFGQQQASFERLLVQSQKTADTLDAGVGNLVDADLAKESARLTSDQTRQSLAVQALAIANAAPKFISALFRR